MTKTFPNISKYLPQILALLFLLAFAVYAWQEPSQAPPGGNVAAPLNVSNFGQEKAGGLILNTGNATTGLIVDKGKVGIGTQSPSEKLEIDGNIKVHGTGVLRRQMFTSSGDFIVPAGVTKVWVTVVGGGGGGGGGGGAPWSGGANAYAGGGGGGGAGQKKLLEITGLTPENSISITVGSGGSGGAGGVIQSPGTPGQSGTTGGNSSFGSFVTSSGGSGGGGGPYYASSGWNIPEVGGSGGNVGGNPGGTSGYGVGKGGAGGDGYMGYGGGGRGGVGAKSGTGSFNSTPGSSGTNGVVIVEW